MKNKNLTQPKSQIEIRVSSNLYLLNSSSNSIPFTNQSINLSFQPHNTNEKSQNSKPTSKSSKLNSIFKKNSKTASNWSPSKESITLSLFSSTTAPTFLKLANIWHLIDFSTKKFILLLTGFQYFWKISTLLPSKWKIIVSGKSFKNNKSSSFSKKYLLTAETSTFSNSFLFWKNLHSFILTRKWHMNKENSTKENNASKSNKFSKKSKSTNKKCSKSISKKFNDCKKESTTPTTKLNKKSKLKADKMMNWLKKWSSKEQMILRKIRNPEYQNNPKTKTYTNPKSQLHFTARPSSAKWTPSWISNRTHLWPWQNRRKLSTFMRLSTWMTSRVSAIKWENLTCLFSRFTQVSKTQESSIKSSSAKRKIFQQSKTVRFKQMTKKVFYFLCLGLKELREKLNERN